MTRVWILLRRYESNSSDIVLGVYSSEKELRFASITYYDEYKGEVPVHYRQEVIELDALKSVPSKQLSERITPHLFKEEERANELVELRREGLYKYDIRLVGVIRADIENGQWLRVQVKLQEKIIKSTKEKPIHFVDGGETSIKLHRESFERRNPLIWSSLGLEKYVREASYG